MVGESSRLPLRKERRDRLYPFAVIGLLPSHLQRNSELIRFFLKQFLVTYRSLMNNRQPSADSAIGTRVRRTFQAVDATKDMTQTHLRKRSSETASKRPRHENQIVRLPASRLKPEFW